MKTNKKMIQQLVGTAVLAALIVILQLVASGIKIGPFTITLSLVPIILGACLFGPASGAFLGAVFGGMVCISVVTGADPGGHLMFLELPVLTLVLCILKSTVAGLVAGLLSRFIKNRVVAIRSGISFDQLFSANCFKLTLVVLRNSSNRIIIIQIDYYLSQCKHRPYCFVRCS